MKLTIKQNKQGKWYAQVYLGTAADGRKIRPYKTFPDATNEQEAREMANKWANTLVLDGSSVKTTLLTDLLDGYINDRAASNIAPNTARQWRMFNRLYVTKYLGNAFVQNLTPSDMSKFESKLLTSKERGGQGLKRGTVRDIHVFLTVAFNHFVKLGICENNPMKSVQRPRPDRHEAALFDEVDFATLDKALLKIMSQMPRTKKEMKNVAYGFAAWLALHTGMRCGEVCAVRRRDISRRLSRLHCSGNIVELGHRQVRRMDTKGRKSRNISLTEHELEQIYNFESKQDTFWKLKGTPATPLITADKHYMQPSTVSSAFRRIRDANGLPKACTFHSLRHTHATWLLLSGVDIKTVSERLGHSDASITLKVYAHVLPGRDMAAAKAFEKFSDEVLEESEK